MNADSHIIRNGSELRVCPQGIPDWQFKASSAATKFANPNEEFSIEAWVETIVNAKVPEDLDVNRGTSEDCLFLDVHVPRSTYEGRKKKRHSGSPVLAWVSISSDLSDLSSSDFCDTDPWRRRHPRCKVRLS